MDSRDLFRDEITMVVWIIGMRLTSLYVAALHPLEKEDSAYKMSAYVDDGTTLTKRRMLGEINSCFHERKHSSGTIAIVISEHDIAGR